MWGLRLPLQPQAASKLEKVVLSCLTESKHRRDPMLFVLGCYISVFLWVPRCMPHDPQIFGVVGGIGAVVGVNKTIPPITCSNNFIISSLKQKHALAQAGTSRAQATPKQIWIILAGEVGGFSFRPSSKENAHFVIVVNTSEAIAVGRPTLATS